MSNSHHFFTCIFALIGIGVTLRYIIVPCIDATLFAIGATIFYVLHTDIEKVKERPLSALKDLVLIFVDHLVDRSTYQKKSKTWEWKPYFHYRRRK